MSDKLTNSLIKWKIIPGNQKTMVGTVKEFQKKTFTREDLRHYLQKLSNELVKKGPGKIGIAYHLRETGETMPAIMTTIGEQVRLLDDLYEARQRGGDNIIDAIAIYVIKDNTTATHRRATKNSLN